MGLSPDVPHSASCAYLLLKQPRTSWVPPPDGTQKIRGGTDPGEAVGEPRG